MLNEILWYIKNSWFDWVKYTTLFILIMISIHNFPFQTLFVLMILGFFGLGYLDYKARKFAEKLDKLNENK